MAGLNRTNDIPSWVPQIGMKFNTLDEAWYFWQHYGVRIGFGVRKRYSNLQETCHLMPSQRKISEIQVIEIDIADDSGIQPKVAHEAASRRVSGSSFITYTRQDHKNYLRTKRQRELAYGEAGSMLKYFQDRIAENTSFQYAIQLDCEEQITDIFWADAKMIIDYANFGDVVTFDTTFGTNKEHRPFGVFVGFNHFRETIIFGACLLYDETFDSFKWLFETFVSIHNQRHPRTIYTDQDAAMGKAVEHVFSTTQHGLCTFHIMQNAVKHLSRHREKEEEEEEEEDDGSNILADFSACMFEYEDKAKFEEAFDIMRTKVEKHTWFDSIYKVKEKWAECYMRDAFTLGMRSTQLSESLNNDLKHHLKANLDVIRFFKHFERAVQGKRDIELDSEFESKELKFSNLTTKVAGSQECCILLENALDTVGKEVEARMKNGSESKDNEGCDTQVMPESNELLSAARLKKKSPKKKTAKRKLSWVDKFHKKRKTGRATGSQELPKQQENRRKTSQRQHNDRRKKTQQQENRPKTSQQEENRMETSQSQSESGLGSILNDSEGHGFLTSFTDLLTVGSVDIDAEEFFLSHGKLQ
ncbi:protein FAR1-RELATED SEQUENCE 5-like [Brachypodium distachyon]|uniref:protein FAR1-RELATED SEQUENCE 5-like n=1 Tax=Brachypodium distachyon TaxID=15368 RepID=UPI00052FE82C|nr:protein FAR1-RELATED SEQUENCE 5-like [Brachypodium distachyon]|eukprot:XP_010233013.1 protein FAR1-RELATED SEQUENCE 5-like [Brachypodium distachyon]